MNKDIRKNRPQISIITIVRNGVNEIEETIKSVLNQNFVNIEYIIIDGKSTDGTLKIIDKYKDEISKIISEPDSGIYDAVNKGIKLATGELIGLIHCGDKYEKDILHLCFEKYTKEKVDILYGDINILESIRGLQFTQLRKANHLLLSGRMSIYHPATFISRECYNLHGTYNEKYKIAADYEFFLRNYKRGVSFEYIPITMATFRTGGISGNFTQLVFELFSIWKKYLGIIKAIRLTLSRVFINVFYVLRQKAAMFIIGKNNYDKLKIYRYKSNG